METAQVMEGKREEDADELNRRLITALSAASPESLPLTSWGIICDQRRASSNLRTH